VSPPKVHTVRKIRQAWGRRFAPTGRDHSDCPDGNIIDRWQIVLRARASLVQSAGLGWSLDSHLTLDWAKKSFERIARRQSVGKNLNTSLVRRGFSKYPCHFLNGAISSVRNCAKARRHYVQDNPTFGYAVKGSAVTDFAFVGRCCWSRDLRWGLRPSSSLSRSNIPLGSLAVLSA
jgi:hypothetical protein